MTQHAAFIKLLGDTGSVAAELGLKESAVSMWKRRGVSWRYRPAVAELAEAKRVSIPEGFLDPAQAAA